MLDRTQTFVLSIVAIVVGAALAIAHVETFPAILITAGVTVLVPSGITKGD